MWGVTILSLIGVVLNIKKKRVCFVVWAFTNASWCIYDFCIGAYEQSALFAVYFGLSIWGIIEWKKNKQGGGVVAQKTIKLLGGVEVSVDFSQKKAKCKKCGKPILWAKSTASGRFIPIAESKDHPGRWMAHFADCKYAADFRRDHN